MHRPPSIFDDTRDHLTTDVLLTAGIIGSGVYVTTMAQGSTTWSFLSGFLAATMLLGATALSHPGTLFERSDGRPNPTAAEPDLTLEP
ncbi:hypothetical protein [Rhodococcoides navarretei]|uniref:Uncharacterized protein n=1 Tax=Rhodococcus navarretei TaxID=3128981 RepID=A0ABU9D5Y4_9NOCA